MEVGGVPDHRGTLQAPYGPSLRDWGRSFWDDRAARLRQVAFKLRDESLPGHTLF